MTAAKPWRFEPVDVAQRLRQVSAELDAILIERGMSEHARFGARLVTEEIVLNAFEHGGARYVDMQVGPGDVPHELVFEDDGVPFDPSLRAPLSESHASEDAPARGRGLILVHGFTRAIEHSRVDGRNRLSVLLVE